jgi:dihydroneopterin aldolase
VIVVKLGGSLAEGGALAGWLAALAGGGGRVVVVPGGGPFADAVRAEQQRHAFSDRAAHHMALLAMEIYALMLADLMPCLVLCRSLAETRNALANGDVPLWLPSAMVLADRSIPESWDVTSDSLAAWLGRRLEASTVALVKSVDTPSSLDPSAMAVRGLVDPEFPRFLAQSGARLEMLGPGDEARLARLVAAGSP